MAVNKLSAELQVALRYENLLTQQTKSLFIKDVMLGIWEVIVQYVDDLQEVKEKVGFEVYFLGQGYAQIIIQRNKIIELTNYPNIIYVSTAQPMKYINVELEQVCADQISMPTGSYQITGRDFLLAVIDSGIDSMHDDFRNDDGTTRIKCIWDQGIEGSPPSGFSDGTVYTEEQINTALKASTKKETLELVPSMDELGHGTAITGIAGGNGRASVGRRNKGMAPQCNFIIIKVKRASGGLAPTTLELMQGIHFSLIEAKKLQIPLVILIGVGYNMASHDGDGILSKYIESAYRTWICNIVAGTGNEADRGSHYQGKLINGQQDEVELLLEGNLTKYSCAIWSPISDEIEIVIQSPGGEQTETLSILTPSRAYLFKQTAVIVNFSDTIINVTQNQIFITLQGQNGQNINKGIWKIFITGKSVLDGRYNIWTKIVPDRQNKTKLLSPELDITITVPGDARGITTVGAYNGNTMQLAGFSGRGYTLDGRVKPELVAPGVNVTVPSSREGELYTVMSGTSVAAAFVAGAYILMQAYGIVQLGNIGLYGDALETYLIRNAKRPTANGPYPNKSWGYGILCVEAALNNMREVANNTN